MGCTLPLAYPVFSVTSPLPCRSAEVWTPGVPPAEGDLPRESEAPQELYGWSGLEGKQLLLESPLPTVASGLERGKGLEELFYRGTANIHDTPVGRYVALRLQLDSSNFVVRVESRRVGYCILTLTIHLCSH